MDLTLIILSAIEKSSHITQRTLAQKANISLGTTNNVIKKMAEDGLVKFKKNSSPGDLLLLYGSENNTYHMLTFLLERTVARKEVAIKKVNTVKQIYHNDTVIFFDVEDACMLARFTSVNILANIA